MDICTHTINYAQGSTPKQIAEDMEAELRAHQRSGWELDTYEIIKDEEKEPLRFGDYKYTAIMIFKKSSIPSG